MQDDLKARTYRDLPILEIAKKKIQWLIEEQEAQVVTFSEHTDIPEMVFVVLVLPNGNRARVDYWGGVKWRMELSQEEQEKIFMYKLPG